MNRLIRRGRSDRMKEPVTLGLARRQVIFAPEERTPTDDTRAGQMTDLFELIPRDDYRDGADGLGDGGGGDDADEVSASSPPGPRIQCQSAQGNLRKPRMLRTNVRRLTADPSNSGQA